MIFENRASDFRSVRRLSDMANGLAAERIDAVVTAHSLDPKAIEAATGFVVGHS